MERNSLAKRTKAELVQLLRERFEFVVEDVHKTLKNTLIDLVLEKEAAAKSSKKQQKHQQHQHQQQQQQKKSTKMSQDPFYVVKEEVQTSTNGISTLFARWQELLHTTNTAKDEEFRWTTGELKVDLEEIVSIVEKNRKKFHLSDEELASRKAFIVDLQKRVAEIKDALGSAEARGKQENDERNVYHTCIQTNMSTYRASEVAEHNDYDDLWIIIDNKVYDVTSFVDDHPGGDEVLLDYAGADASSAFVDVGHSSEAIDMLEEFFIGNLIDEEINSLKGKKTWEFEGLLDDDVLIIAEAITEDDKVKNLRIKGEAVSDKSIIEIAKVLPTSQLQLFDLNYRNQITDKSIIEIAKALPTSLLQSLILTGTFVSEDLKDRIKTLLEENEKRIANQPKTKPKPKPTPLTIDNNPFLTFEKVLNHYQNLRSTTENTSNNDNNEQSTLIPYKAYCEILRNFGRIKIKLSNLQQTVSIKEWRKYEEASSEFNKACKKLSKACEEGNKDTVQSLVKERDQLCKSLVERILHFKKTRAIDKEFNNNSNKCKAIVSNIKSILNNNNNNNNNHKIVVPNDFLKGVNKKVEEHSKIAADIEKKLDNVRKNTDNAMENVSEAMQVVWKKFKISQPANEVFDATKANDSLQQFIDCMNIESEATVNEEPSSEMLQSLSETVQILSQVCQNILNESIIPLEDSLVDANSRLQEIEQRAQGAPSLKFLQDFEKAEKKARKDFKKHARRIEFRLDGIGSSDEEDETGNHVDTETLKEQLKPLRKKWRECAARFEKERVALFLLAQTWFPELRFQSEAIECAMNGDDALDGTRTLEQFDDIRLLSNGKSGSSHKSQSAVYNDEKCVLKEFAFHDGKELHAFKKEVKFLRRLRHPHIVELQSAFVMKAGARLESAVIQMPFYVHGNLWQWKASLDNDVDIDLLKRVFRGALLGLAHVHSHQVIHADVKPQNIFVDKDHQAKLGDFDVSKDSSARAQMLTTMATTAGHTLSYLAPELLNASTKASPASDVYAFGLTMFDVCYGDTEETPFQRPPVADIMYKGAQIIVLNSKEGSIPVDLKNLIFQCLDTEPSKRPTAFAACNCECFEDTLASNNTSVEECLLCNYEKPARKGVRCADEKHRHFICDECFSSHIALNLATVRKIFTKNGYGVRCPITQNNAHDELPYSDILLARALPKETYEQIAKAREEVREEDSRKKMSIEIEKRLKELQDRSDISSTLKK